MQAAVESGGVTMLTTTRTSDDVDEVTKAGLARLIARCRRESVEQDRTMAGLTGFQRRSG